MSATITRGETGSGVAPGVHRQGSDRVNWYVIEDEGRFTVVDAGFAGHWGQLVEFLEARDADLDAVDALVLTHGHLDHVGFAERLRREGVTVYAHEADDYLLAEAGGPIPRFFLRNLYRPHVVSFPIEGLRAGVNDAEPVIVYERLEGGRTLDVPGTPTVLHVPGHTPSSCALVLRDRDVVLAGDALMGWNLRTGRFTEPELPVIATDRDLARESLSRFEDLGTVTVLTGHGEPWALGDRARRARADG